MKKTIELTKVGSNLIKSQQVSWLEWGDNGEV